MAREIEMVGVLGAGLMGHGIAQVAAQSGYAVVLRELDEQRIAGTTDYEELANCDLVIEAITENLELKLEMWGEVDRVVKPEAIFATNTSSLAVIDQAATTTRAERFVGLHYFNPAQVMKLVEVVRCVTTSDETFAAGLAFGGQARDPDHRQGWVHRQPAARSVHARCDPRAGRGGRLDQRDRRGDEG